MKKVVIIGFNYYHYLDCFVHAFERNGYNVRKSESVPFAIYLRKNYIRKKLYDFGIGKGEKEYLQALNKEHVRVINEFGPSICFVINGERINEELLLLLKEKSIRVILFLMDGLYYLSNTNEMLNHYNEVYSYEPKDENGKIKYMPLGYDNTIFSTDKTNNKDIDICFVGHPDQKRLEYLECVAKYSRENKRNFVVYAGANIFGDGKIIHFGGGDFKKKKII